jgi:SAM-dependent methyltransferase
MYDVNIKITEELLHQRFEDPEFDRAVYDRNREAFEYFAPYVYGSILEMGCRDGVLLDVLRANGYNNLYGIDISDEAVLISQQKGYRAEVLPMEECSKLNKQFDTIFCLHALEHSIDVDKTISEMYNISNGNVLIEVPMQPKEPVPTKWGHFYCFSSEEEVISMFEKHGFTKVALFSQPPKRWRRFVFKKQNG